jgi:hypothetical protein
MDRSDLDLPSEILDTVVDYMSRAGLDFAAVAAVRGQCETQSYALVRHLRAAGLDAGVVQVWTESVPAVLADDEMAPGHFVVAVRYDDQRYRIDLTAAQFPALGWTGPRGEEMF